MLDPSDKTDRRIEKSKAALIHALVELMIEVGYEAPTVADIAKRANVGRSTFYAHFADKEDLLREAFQGLRGYLVEAARSKPERGVHPALAFSLPMLEHVSESRGLFTSIVSRRSIAVDLVNEMLSDLVTEILARHGVCEPNAMAIGPGSPPVGHALVARHVVGSFLAVCAWWMTQDPTRSPEQVDAAFRALVEPGLGPVRQDPGGEIRAEAP